MLGRYFQISVISSTLYAFTSTKDMESMTENMIYYVNLMAYDFKQSNLATIQVNGELKMAFPGRCSIKSKA